MAHSCNLSIQEGRGWRIGLSVTKFSLCTQWALSHIYSKTVSRKQNKAYKTLQNQLKSPEEMERHMMDLILMLWSQYPPKLIYRIKVLPTKIQAGYRNWKQHGKVVHAFKPSIREAEASKFEVSLTYMGSSRLVRTIRQDSAYKKIRKETDKLNWNSHRILRNWNMSLE